ncbi:MAG: caspase family protein [Bryobacteraceae bacterium]
MILLWLFVSLMLLLGAMQAPRDLKLEWERLEPQSTAASKRWALVVGISSYRNLPPQSQLRYAHRDAEDFARFLRASQGGALGPTQVRLLTEKDATLGAVRSALQEWLPAVAGPRDVVYIYFAGHGVIGERNEPYFVAHDSDPQNLHATGLAFRELNETIGKRLRAQAVVLMADACHAGGIGWADASDSLPLAGPALESLAAGDRMFLKILASRGTERSFEDARWGGGHGVFTYSLLRALQGEADREKDGFVRASELVEFVGKEVAEQTGSRQNPRVAGNFEPRLALAATPRGAANAAQNPATLTVIGPPGAVVYVDDVFLGAVRPTGQLTVDGLVVGAHKLGVDLADGVSLEQQLALGASTSIDVAHLPGVALARLQNMIAAGQVLGKGEALEFFRTHNWDAQYRPSAAVLVTGALENLGQACVNDYVQSDSMVLKRPMLVRAVEAFQALRTLRPNDAMIPAKIYFCEARAQIAGGEFAAAEKNLLASIALEKDFACAYNALGVALGRMGRSAEARAAFDKAAELNPQWGLPYFQIGQAILNAGQPVPALPYLEKSVKLYPRATLPRWFLMRGYRMAGQGADFERTARELLNANPNYAPTYLELGNYFEGRKDFARATQAFDAYLALAPNFADSAAVRQRVERSRAQTGRQAPSLLKKR